MSDRVQQVLGISFAAPTCSLGSVTEQLVEQAAWLQLQGLLHSCHESGQVELALQRAVCSSIHPLPASAAPLSVKALAAGPAGCTAIVNNSWCEDLTV